MQGFCVHASGYTSGAYLQIASARSISNIIGPQNGQARSCCMGAQGRRNETGTAQLSRSHSRPAVWSWPYVVANPACVDVSFFLFHLLAHYSWHGINIRQLSPLSSATICSKPRRNVCHRAYLDRSDDHAAWAPCSLAG